MNKTFIIFCLIFCFPNNTYSQDCPNESGTRIKKLINGTYSVLEDICFTDKDDSSLNVYNTSYTFSIKGEDLYTLDFKFFKLLDSININCYNIKTGHSKKDTFKLKEKGSRIMFINYTENDTSIRLTTHSKMLFTIQDERYITLNSFQPFDDKETYITAYKINKEFLKKHQDDSKQFWQNKKEEDVKKQGIVDRFITDINDSLNRILIKIKKADSTFLSDKTPYVAPPQVLAAFKNKLDTIIVAELKKNYFSFSQINDTINYTFVCDSTGKIDTSKTDIKSRSQSDWFSNIFQNKMYPLIKADSFEIFTETKNNPDLEEEFSMQFSNFKAANETDYKQFDSISKTQRKVLLQLQLYSIKCPTKYYYTLNYKSTVKKATWEYKKNKKDGKEEFTDITKGAGSDIQAITENLKNIFRKKIAMEDKKRYNIIICNVDINGIPIGQDIQLDPKK